MIVIVSAMPAVGTMDEKDFLANDTRHSGSRTELSITWHTVKVVCSERYGGSTETKGNDITSYSLPDLPNCKVPIGEDGWLEGLVIDVYLKLIDKGDKG